MRIDVNVVVIFVIRAFNCTALAFENDASDVFCVKGIEQVIRLKKLFPERILIGEEKDLKHANLNRSNSPNEIINFDVHKI